MDGGSGQTRFETMGWVSEGRVDLWVQKHGRIDKCGVVKSPDCGGLEKAREKGGTASAPLILEPSP